jgi:hypothetical protein
LYRNLEQAYHAFTEASKPRKVDVLRGAFPEQIAAIHDPHRLKMFFCTRRAAKSYTDGLYMVKTGLDFPACNVLYLGLTRQSAKDIIWKDVLKDIDRRHSVGMKPHLTELSMTLPTESLLSITGVDAEEEEMHKLLGRKYKLVIIDEASLYTIDLNKLVYGILKPAMADQQGTIVLSGTASNLTRGLFYKITEMLKLPNGTYQNKGVFRLLDWSVHAWTTYDNPYNAKQWHEEIEEIRRDRPDFMYTPLFLQWYLNQWVVDKEKLVYKFDAEKNYFTILPPLSPDGWTFVLGIDLGWEDDTAFVLACFHANDHRMYVIDDYASKGMTLPVVEARINYYLGGKFKFQGLTATPSRVIIDGSAKQAIETMRTKTNIPFEYADKLGKEAFIEICNADIIQSKILFHTGLSGLPSEMMGLIWECEGEQVKMPRREHPRLPNHRTDAFLYNWRMCFHHHFEPKTKQVVVGSKEWYEKQAEDIWEREREQIQRMEQGDNGLTWPTEGGGFGNW